MVDKNFLNLVCSWNVFPSLLVVTDSFSDYSSLDLPHCCLFFSCEECVRVGAGHSVISCSLYFDQLWLSVVTSVAKTSFLDEGSGAVLSLSIRINI